MMAPSTTAGSLSSSSTAETSEKEKVIIEQTNFNCLILNKQNQLVRSYQLKTNLDEKVVWVQISQQDSRWCHWTRAGTCQSCRWSCRPSCWPSTLSSAGGGIAALTRAWKFDVKINQIDLKRLYYSGCSDILRGVRVRGCLTHQKK